MTKLMAGLTMVKIFVLKKILGDKRWTKVKIGKWLFYTVQWPLPHTASCEQNR